MFRAAAIALALSSTPALAMSHAECVKLLTEAYEAKEQSWQTAQALYEGAGDEDAREAAKGEGMSARFAAQKYISALADYCETLR